MRFSHKVSLGISVLVTFLVIIVMAVVSVTTIRAIETKIEKDLTAAQSVFTRFQEIRFEKFVTFNTMLAETPYLKALATTPDLEKELILKIADRIRESVGGDYLAVGNARGEILGSVGYDRIAKTYYPQQRAVKAALAGENHQGFWTIDKGMMQVVASPFRFGEEIVGFLVTGFTIDPATMASLEAMTNSHVAILAANRVVTSSAVENPLERLLESPGASELTSGKVSQLVLNEEKYLVLEKDLPGSSLSFMMARSLDGELAFYYELQKRLLYMAGVIIILALGLGFLYSRMITKPVQALVRRTRQIAAGDFTSRVGLESRDEMGDLSRAFDKMAETLEATTVSRKYVSNILESMINSVIVLSPEGIIRKVNKNTCDLLGYKEEELIGKDAVIFLGRQQETELTRSKSLEARKQALAGIRELNYYNKKGGEIPVAFSAAAVQKDNASGEIDGFVCVALDITEQKRLENQLSQAQKMESVGQLAAGVAHEVNNPIGVIYGFAQSILKRMKPGDPLEMPIKSIEREASRCRELVQDLLTFSRSSVKTKEEISLNDAVEEALSLVMAQSKFKLIKLQKELEEDLPRVFANKNQLQQVVINLSNNAIDAMDDSGVLIIRTRGIPNPDEPKVALEVADNGGGMDEQTRKHIFEPFFTTKEVGKGTGLGLSLVYEIVTSHEGKIEIESELEKGTVFHVVLPASKASMVEHAA